MLQIIELFDGATFSGISTWKPVQTGIKLSTISVLQMFDTLVVSGESMQVLADKQAELPWNSINAQPEIGLYCPGVEASIKQSRFMSFSPFYVAVLVCFMFSSFLCRMT